jgi:4-coumarate--CoA ligase
MRLLTLWIIGGRVNGASPAYNAEEMTHALKTAKSKFLITLPSSLEVALTAAKNAGIPQKHVFLLEGKVDGFLSIQELMKRGERYQIVPPWRIPKGKDNRQVCGYLNFSSGTTGLPKVI